MGDWRDNMMHGFGIFTFADGRVYRGEYVRDKKEGPGVFEWPDGREFEGTWQDGKQHGVARYKKATGEVQVGLWENGRRIKWIEDKFACTTTPGETTEETPK